MWLFGNSEQPLFDLLLFLLSSLLFCEKKRSKLGVSKEGKGARVEVKWMLGREEQAMCEMDVGERRASVCNYQLKSAPDCN